MSRFDEENVFPGEKQQGYITLSLIPFPVIGKVLPWENISIDFSLLFRSRSRRSMNIQNIFKELFCDISNKKISG